MFTFTEMQKMNMQLAVDLNYNIILKTVNKTSNTKNEIFIFLGKVHEAYLGTINGNKTFNLNTSELNEGSYIYRIKYQNGEHMIQKDNYK